MTWRMDGIEAMFMPKYLDESIQMAADGESDIPGAAAFGKEEMARMAKIVMKKFGEKKVTKEIVERRRKEDAPGAKKSARDALEHWKAFFAGNDKYKVVGSVIHDTDKPDPPAPCEAAMQKRPIKGGAMAEFLKPGGAGDGVLPGGQKRTGVMPDYVKEVIKNRKGGDEAEGVRRDEVKDEDDEDLVRDEL